jgi:hypothetical protein
MGKLNVITTGFENGKFNWSDQYNLFSGLIGGFFLPYLILAPTRPGRQVPPARSLKESRMGLLTDW